MKLVWWMPAGSILSSLILSILLSSGIRVEIWLGMLGPLAVAIISWIAIERQHRKRPAGLTSLMIKEFAAKMIFFALYVTVLLSIGLVQPVPFVIVFMCHFIFLHVVEVIGLRRLQAAGISASPEIIRGPLGNG
jgi:hypothetical protein